MEAKIYLNIKKFIFNLKNQIIPIFFIITLIISISQSYSCQDEQLKEKNEKEAIELVQNYISPLTKMKLIDVMKFSFNLSKASGRIFEIHGWSSAKISDEANQYKVSFSYRDITTEMKIEWVVDLDSGNINPLDDLASQLMQ
ncbi:MAG: hypothetical protein ACYDA4_15790 [Ignavibacteriaceae bacterium]